jgi:cytoskeletal protein CcmA (bactofilin family)
MSNHIDINGLRIDAEGDKITIDLSGRKPSAKGEDIVFQKDGTINGDIQGNIACIGNNITLTIVGDVVGNITGDKVNIKGDVIGNINAAQVTR